MLGRPHVKVGFGPLGKAPQQVLFADDLYHRPIDLVIPMGRGFLVGDVALLCQSHEMAVDVDMLIQRRILPRQRKLQVRLGTQFVQMRVFEKISILGFEHYVFDVVLGRKRDGGL